MIYQVYKPSLLLEPYVRFFWVLECDLKGVEEYIHRSMADCFPELIFHYKGTFTDLNTDVTEDNFASGLQAQTTTFSRFSTAESFGIFGVYLYPYTITSLTGIPAHELNNQFIRLTDIFGNESGELQERIMCATSTEERIVLISTFLTTRIKSNNAVHSGIFSSVNILMNQHGRVSIDDLADHSNLSLRQFERNFKQFSGFSPKFFSRILRFQAALQQYPLKKKSLTDVALECGYYDQSHFIRDFKEFSGQHPSLYFSGNGEGTQWKDP